MVIPEINIGSQMYTHFLVAYNTHMVGNKLDLEILVLRKLIT